MAKSAFVTDVIEIVNIDDENSATLRKLGPMEILKMQHEASIRQDGFRYDNTFLMNCLVIKNCLVSWDGPAFAGAEITVENITRLETNFLEPILKKAMDLLTTSEDEKKVLSLPTSTQSSMG